MADHVGVGEIHDDGVEIAFFDGFHDRVGDSCGGHFRFEVVGGDFRRGHQNALLAAEGLFDAAIEKISDVRVFFGFGNAQIFVMQLAKNLREDVLEFFRRDGRSAARATSFRTASWRRRRDSSGASDRRIS